MIGLLRFVLGILASPFKNAQNCFLYHLLLVVVASTFGFQIYEIETRSLPSQADAHRQHLARHRRTFKPPRRASASEQGFCRAGLLTGALPHRYLETGAAAIPCRPKNWCPP